MQNPFDPNYLTAASAAFGPFAWIFFALQLAATLAGLYILFARTDNNAVSREQWRRLGIVLVSAGGVGLLFGVLRLLNVPVFNQRYWFYLLLLVELGLAAYIFYYARTVYPQLVAASQTRGRASAQPVRRAGSSAASRSVSTPSGGSGGSLPTPPTVRPASTSSRRESRRERKRRQR